LFWNGLRVIYRSHLQLMRIKLTFQQSTLALKLYAGNSNKDPISLSGCDKRGRARRLTIVQAGDVDFLQKKLKTRHLNCQMFPRLADGTSSRYVASVEARMYLFASGDLSSIYRGNNKSRVSHRSASVSLRPNT